MSMTKIDCIFKEYSEFTRRIYKNPLYSLTIY